MRTTKTIITLGALAVLGLGDNALAGTATWTEEAKAAKNALERGASPAQRRALRVSVATGTITDPTGDVFGDPITPKTDLTQLSATTTNGSLVIALTFAGDISPCENGNGTITPTQTPVGGFVDIDADTVVVRALGNDSHTVALSRAGQPYRDGNGFYTSNNLCRANWR